MAPFADNYPANNDNESQHSIVALDGGLMKKKERQSQGVQFGTIEIRDYERIAGDHPDVYRGPPMSIGWAFQEKPAISVDVYEEERESNRRRNFRLTGKTRRRILLEEFKVSEEELDFAEKEAHKVAKERKSTTHQSKTSERMGEAARAATKSVRRAFASREERRYERSIIRAVEASKMIPLSIAA